MNVAGASIVLGALLLNACTGSVQSDEASGADVPVPPSEVAIAAPTTPPAMIPAPAPPPAQVAAPAASPPPTVPMASPIMPAPAPSPMPPAQPTAPSTSPPALGTQGAMEAAPIFDAGSGTLQADGKTVVFHIVDGTAGKDWNSMDKPVRVERGMTLHLIDDDTLKQHLLHTLETCIHGSRAIGTGYDCVIQQTAPSGMVNGVYDHNGDGGRGRFYIEVVE